MPAMPHCAAKYSSSFLRSSSTGRLLSCCDAWEIGTDDHQANTVSAQPLATPLPPIAAYLKPPQAQVVVRHGFGRKAGLSKGGLHKLANHDDRARRVRQRHSACRFGVRLAELHDMPGDAKPRTLPATRS